MEDWSTGWVGMGAAARHRTSTYSYWTSRNYEQDMDSRTDCIIIDPLAHRAAVGGLDLI